VPDVHGEDLWAAFDRVVSMAQPAARLLATVTRYTCFRPDFAGKSDIELRGSLASDAELWNSVFSLFLIKNIDQAI